MLALVCLLQEPLTRASQKWPLVYWAAENPVFCGSGSVSALVSDPVNDELKRGWGKLTKREKLQILALIESFR